MSARPAGLRYRAAVLARVALAALGGYAVAALATGLLAQVLPLVLPVPRSEAVATATLLSFAVVVAVAVGVFAMRSALGAALFVGALAVPLGTGLWLVRALGAAA